MITKPRATIEHLYHVPEDKKAELVNGELIPMSPAGAKPGRAAGKIYTSLSNHEETQGGGYAFSDNVGFLVALPHRESFSPDAAWYIGTLEDVDAMEFLEGAPVFAAEVRSKSDYGPKAEADIAAKFRDYFAAGTQVVWDVDMLSEEVVKVYRADAPETPTIYRRGELAEAEPAVPGWTLPVDRLFDKL